MTDFFTPARCSSSGQTCSTSDVVRPEVNRINGLTEVEDKHVCPLVRPLFVLKMKAIVCFSDMLSSIEFAQKMLPSQMGLRALPKPWLWRCSH